MNRAPLTAMVLALGLVQGCGDGTRGGDSGPRLSIQAGPTVVGPGGRLDLTAYGTGGPLSWALVPPGLGTFLPKSAAAIPAPTSPPLTYGLAGTFNAGSSLGAAEFQVATGEGAHRLQASVLLQVVQGVSIAPAATDILVTPQLQKSIAVSVAAPGFTELQVPQQVSWSPEGDFADGQILASAPGRLVFNAPTRAGSYVLKGVAVADPSATARVRVVVQ